MLQEASEPRPVRHKALSDFYTHIYSIKGYLHFLLPASDWGELERSTDPQEYTSLLRDTLCAFDGPLPSSDAKVPKERWYPSHADAVNHALRRIGKQGLSRSASGSGLGFGSGLFGGGEGRVRSGPDVLLASVRLPQPQLPVNPHRPLGSGGSHPVGGPAATLRTLEWQILRSRVGDGAWQAVVCRTSIFLPVGNNCFMQLSGKGVHDVYEERAGVLKAREMEKGREEVEGGKRKRLEVGGSGKRKKKRRKIGHAPKIKGDSGGATSWEGDATPLGELFNEAVRRNTHPPASRSSRLSGPSPADRQLARGRMFYGQPTREKNGKIQLGLPQGHILCCLSNSPSLNENANGTASTAAQILLETIFAPSVSTQHPRLRLLQPVMDADRFQKTISTSKARLQNMTKAMSELLARHRSVLYSTLIRRSFERRDPTRTELQPITHRQVQRLVCSVLRALVSPYLLGSAGNVSVLVKHAKRFVCLKQFEQVTLHEVLQEIKVDEVRWLTLDQEGRAGAQDAQKRRELLGRFVKWLFDDLLVPLLKNTFYITETAETKYETVYYSHADWWAATQPHLSHLKSTLLEPLRADEIPHAASHPLGISAVRLIPKPNGFRPIVNLGRQIKLAATSYAGASYSSSTARVKTANAKLRNIHSVLTLERDRKRGELGATLFGTNEVFEPIRQLKLELLERGRVKDGGSGARQGDELPRLYFVKMDIKAAFDTIKQEKMLQVIEGMLDQDNDYLLMMAALLLPPPSEGSQSKARRIFKHRALVDDALASSLTEPSRRIAQPLRNAIIIDLARRQRLTRGQVMTLLRRHITDNVWQLGTEYHRQRTGIPQGSRISSLLCSFFYAAMENQYLAWTRQPGSRLLRYIDDFLFITDDYRAARRFVGQMSEGFAAYGAQVSKGKTLLSFEYSTGDEVAPIALPSSAAGGPSLFPYCGFLIDTRTLELRMDHPRVLQVHIRQTFALRSTRRKGRSFVAWLSRQLENRNHVCYLDTGHNSKETVWFNIFVNFAMTAMKVPHYCKGMPLHASLARLVFDSICTSAEYTYNAGRARVMHAARKVGLQGTYGVARADFLFLAKSAVLKILSRRSARFKTVNHLLAQNLAQASMREPAERLAPIVERGWAAVEHARF